MYLTFPLNVTSVRYGAVSTEQFFEAIGVEFFRLLLKQFLHGLPD
jgi:hypothetical protein